MEQPDRKTERRMDRGHLPDVEALAQGMQRGWLALEAAALANGHKPIDPDAWEARQASGTVYRVVKNNRDLAACPAGPDTTIVTLQSVVNIYHAAISGKIEAPEVKKIVQENNPLPEGGDDLPF